MAAKFVFSCVRSAVLTCLVLLVANAGYAEDLATPDAPQVLAYDAMLTSPTSLQSLLDAGIDVSHVHGSHVTVHVDVAQAAWLRSQGYTLRQIQMGEMPPGWAEQTTSKGLGTYHNYTSLTSELQTQSQNHPAICRLVTLGQSVQGRELWALEISDNPDVEEDEPEFKYVSSMHGNEPVGLEMLLYFSDMLLNGYGNDEHLTRLVDNTVIWIVPLMNPDGHAVTRRYNANNKDLNRVFPRFPTNFTGTMFDGEPLHDETREPEVQHVMRWTAQNSFVLSANMHTGSLVVNYPYDDDRLPSGTNSPTPDDDLFIDVSLRYSSQNPPMYGSPYFSQGIVNGAVWYVITGGMQDWNYRYAGCNEVTLELSDTFIPSQSELPTYWENNRESLLSYLEAAHIGVRGLVTDLVTQAPLWAKVTVQGNTQAVFTDPDIGDYHRMVLPGVYVVRYEAAEYVSKTIENVIVDTGDAARRDVALAPKSYDIDRDDTLAASDAQLVINAALGISIAPLTGDVDGDSAVTAVDVQALINAILQY